MLVNCFWVIKMTDKYIYANSVADVSDAAGVTGVLIKSLGGEYLFRIYHSDHTFTDFELNHDDLAVTINKDALASFYELSDKKVLDHSPQVLGLICANGQNDEDV